MCNTLCNVPHMYNCVDEQPVSALGMKLTQGKVDHVEDSE